MLDARERSAICERAFDIDCPEMKLDQRAATAPLSLAGPGVLRQSPEGALVFKMYVTSKPERSPFEWLFDQNATISLGEWLPEQHFFDLTALDIKGRTWQSQYVSIDITEGEGIIAQGTLAEMSATGNSVQPEASNKTLLLIPGDFDIPINATTRTVVSSYGRTHVSVAANIATFATCDLSFQMWREDKRLLVEIESEKSMPEHIESRVVEALQFVLARPLPWLIMERRTQQVTQIRVRRHHLESRILSLQPPLAYPHREQRIVESVWNLFDCYLRHIIRRSEPDQHPLSQILDLIQEASAGSLHAAGLALGVMVESILNEEFPDLGRGSEDEKRAWDDFGKQVDTWFGAESIKKRIMGFVRSASAPSAKARLQALINADVITIDQYYAWDALRNSYAHGKLPDIETLRQFDSLVRNVTVLMYHLIFEAIGYQGMFSDYSREGWPLGEFFPKLHKMQGQ